MVAPGGARSVKVIVVEMDTAIRVQILNETDSISHSTNPIHQPPPLGQDMTQGQFLSGV